MARIGVSYTEVAQAAAQLIGQSRNPTVEQIRLVLGTGSSTTIANHLRQWKVNREATSLISLKENLPPEFIALMKGLWERVVNHSEEKVSEIEGGYQKTISELQLEVEKYKTNNQRWQKMYDSWIAEKNQFANDKLTFEQALAFSHKENSALHAKHDGLMQQLGDREERIHELNRLHRQSQENLEHYRESAREQRLLDQQQHEQQKQQLQSEIKVLREQLVAMYENNAVLERNHYLLTQANTDLEKHKIQSQFQLDQINSKFQESEKLTIEHLSMHQHLQSQHTELQKMFDTKANQLISQETENKLLLQQFYETKQSLKECQDQMKLLGHEKWELVQEKSHLEGRLKQMQDMMVA